MAILYFSDCCHCAEILNIEGTIMKNSLSFVRLAVVLVFAFIIQACNSYDPVPKSKCGKVVKHAQKVLGKFAPKYSDMMKDCKAASDSERGCIMAATKAGQVAQCM